MMYEYRAAHPPHRTEPVTQHREKVWTDWLNAYATDGWELVSCVDGTWIFRREIPEGGRTY